VVDAAGQGAVHAEGRQPHAVIPPLPRALSRTRRCAPARGAWLDYGPAPAGRQDAAGTAPLWWNFQRPYRVVPIMRAFGFLSFGHYGNGSGVRGLDARRMLHDAIDIAQGADDLGVNGAYFRVHHFATQSASPMPLLAAVAARTRRIEVGTGVID